MNFSQQLNNYMERFECSSKDLISASGLSSAVISRYRNGERTPNVKSKQFESLVNGLYMLGKDKENISKKDIYLCLSSTLNDITISLEQLGSNFNELASVLNINIADLARFINYDASFISKIRNGSRTPSKPKSFVEGVCNYIKNGQDACLTGARCFLNWGKVLALCGHACCPFFILSPNE